MTCEYKINLLAVFELWVQGAFNHLGFREVFIIKYLVFDFQTFGESSFVYFCTNDFNLNVRNKDNDKVKSTRRSKFFF